MKYLLDTHILLWFINGDLELSANARQIINSPINCKFISIATFWEIAIKISIGKLEIKMPYAELDLYITRNGFVLLPITFQHTVALVNLPFYHRDPFDRIIIAQSFCENIPVISKDANFGNYKINTEW
ncbi:type II toxin-antitoxin system VapC family toxin [Dyadobacter sediminis]|uniref:Type II toxin-antitoxin system VapC family toxin n=1 Tax=Dyadobacter sediminis TaxID=1493691 RepID=A0A5R9KA89_9BACT|nr:type II toxin-antitoxin system VapC family toxin [Dyadobacter sediminis]TLU91698.1 type II toxin-antitoxin system VapC family toxin [Dyadobacter sediminis]GGC01111.1 twitching motility protein PilT [Dyadobacter sediminis]